MTNLTDEGLLSSVKEALTGLDCCESNHECGCQEVRIDMMLGLVKQVRDSSKLAMTERIFNAMKLME